VLVFYESDGATIAAAQTFPATDAGTISAPLTLYLYADRGTPGVGYHDVRLVAEAEITSGKWAETGLPILDRQELQARIIGSANPSADPLFSARGVGGWVPLGAGSTISLGDIRGDCAVEIEVRFAPSLDGGTGSIPVNWGLRPVDGVRAVGRRELAEPCGIVTGLGDPSFSEWITAPDVTESGTPDALANVSSRTFVAFGAAETETGHTLTLNQADSASAALASGEAYVALLSQPLAGGAAVATKRAKDVEGSAELPALPDDHLPIASVIVRYQAGGTSVIGTADISSLCSDGRGALRYAADSLSVTVGRVRAVLPAVYVSIPSPTSVTLAPSLTTTLYVAPLGQITTSPAVGSLPLWTVTTDTVGVPGAPTDLRYGTRADTVETL